MVVGDGDQHGLPGYQPQVERITGRTEIVRLLEQLIRRKVLLSLRIEGGDAYYASILLGLDGHPVYLQLDEIPSGPGNPDVKQSTRLEVSGRLTGAQFGFRTEVVAVEHRADGRLYHTVFPELLTYLQRRKSFRVGVEREQRIPVTLALGDRLPCVGALHDISLGGLSVRWPLEPKACKRLDPVPHCTIHIPGERAISCKAQVCDVRQEADAWVVGLRFVSPDHRLRHRVARFVFALERQAARQRHAG